MAIGGIKRYEEWVQKIDKYSKIEEDFLKEKAKLFKPIKNHSSNINNGTDGIDFSNTSKLLSEIGKLVDSNNPNLYDDNYWDLLDNPSKRKQGTWNNGSLINNSKKPIEKPVEKVDNSITDDNFKMYKIRLDHTLLRDNKNPKVLMIKKDNSFWKKLLQRNDKRTKIIETSQSNLNLTIFLNSQYINKNINIPIIDMVDYMIPYYFFTISNKTDKLIIKYNINMNSSKFQVNALKYLKSLDFIKSDKLIDILMDKIDRYLMDFKADILTMLKVGNNIGIGGFYIYELATVSEKDILNYLYDDIDARTVPDELSDYIEINNSDD